MPKDPHIFTADYYRGKNYPKYLLTEHWGDIHEKFIYSNPFVCCWICGELNSLLPHHERYDNLFHEKLYRDIFILCWWCHTELHFARFLVVFQKKIPLTPWHLKRRRLFLKMIFCIRTQQFIQAIWYFLRYLFVL